MADADPPLDAPAAADPDPAAAEPSTSPLNAASNSTPAQLTALLATALADVESLRAELVATRAKADRSERLLATFTRGAASTEPDAHLTLLSPPSWHPHALDERTAAAEDEAARDDAAARLAVLSSVSRTNPSQKKRSAKETRTVLPTFRKEWWEDGEDLGNHGV